MELDEIKKLIDELSIILVRQINDFEDETGVAISNIDLIRYLQFSKEYTPINHINIELSID